MLIEPILYFGEIGLFVKYVLKAEKISRIVSN